MQEITRVFRVDFSLAGAALAAFMLVAAAPRPVMSETTPSYLQTGAHLAELLRAGRSVISSMQSDINAEGVGDKGRGADWFLAEVERVYTDRTGTAPLDAAASQLDSDLITAQLAAMREIIEEAQPLINSTDMGFKGFIPAIFARLVNERFGEKVGRLASVKVTAPMHLVRNRKSRPDTWEADVIESLFSKPDWVPGTPWHEEMTVNGQDIVRILIPEYYTQSCLSCHGQPAGETDITGFPREGGSEGDLGGAISITVVR